MKKNKFVICRPAIFGNSLRKENGYWTNDVNEAQTFNSINDILHYVAINPQVMVSDHSASIAGIITKMVEMDVLRALDKIEI